MNISLVNTSEHIITMCHAIGGGVLCIVVEANIKDPSAYDAESSFSKLLFEAMRSLPPDVATKQLPQEMARAIGSVLINWDAKGFGPRTVMYAGALLLRDEVHVCTAGDCRIHLVTRGRVVASTRDHNLMDDPVEGMITQNADPTLRPIYLGAPTRALGIVTREAEPECLTWKAGGDYTALFCSSAFHKYRKPAEYVDMFMQEELFNVMPREKEVSGVLIKIS